MTARARLTFLFAAMSVTVAIALSAALLLARSSYLYRDAGQHASLRAEIAQRLIEHEADAGGTLKVVTEGGATALVGSLRATLEAGSELLLVLDTAGATIFTSRAVNALSEEDWNTLQSGVAVLRDGGPAGLLPIEGGTLLVARAIRDQPEGIARVVAGVGTGQLLTVPRELALTLAFVLPLIVLIGVWTAWLLLARPFEELDSIAAEVAA
ncbi:MAG TPA: hypothetical protein VMM17_00670, partial [Gemmatimonadaceae bacterium]|nr:hypothetical protein [Gemmatimonadaceae bacterium]